MSFACPSRGWAVVVLFVFLTGCNSGKVPLQGKVTFSDDDSPVSGTVYFQSDTFLARGELKSDGSYIIGSDSVKDGLPPGKYAVYVQETPVVIGTTPSGEPISKNIVAEKFANPKTSGLEFEAGKGEKRFDFTVDRKQ